MVGNHISVVNILPVYAAGNANGISRHQTEWLPEANPAQGHRLSPILASSLSSRD
jgi:hypothetical protein